MRRGTQFVGGVGSLPFLSVRTTVVWGRYGWRSVQSTEEGRSVLVLGFYSSIRRDRVVMQQVVSVDNEPVIFMRHGKYIFFGCRLNDLALLNIFGNLDDQAGGKRCRFQRGRRSSFMEGAHSVIWSRSCQAA